MNENLEWTGERFLPEVTGEIELEHYHRYLLAREYAKKKRVLDIASGEGYGSYLLSKVASSVIGVDISKKAIAHASRHYNDDNLEFRYGDCVEIPLSDNTVDLVVSFETIEHHEHHDAMMLEVCRVLDKNGLLVISSPDKKEYSDIPNYNNPFHVRELYQAEFEATLKKYFKHVIMLGQRIKYGSYIAPIDYLMNAKLVSFRSGTESFDQTNGLFNPLYFIALASNSNHIQTYSGLYESTMDNSEYARNLLQSHDFQLSNQDKKIKKLNEELLNTEKLNQIFFKKKLKALEDRKNTELRLLQWTISQKEQEVFDITSSLSYRVVRVFSKIKNLLVNFGRGSRNLLFLMASFVKLIIRNPVKLQKHMGVGKLKRGLLLLFSDMKAAKRAVKRFANIVTQESRYGSYVGVNDIEKEVYLTKILVSIFIVNYNGKHHLPELMDSIYKQDYPYFEIIVVDNGSSDGSVKFLQNHYPQCKIVVLPDNIGFAEANNIATEVAAGTYYCLLNNDMRVSINWLSELVVYLNTQPNIGAVGSKILFWTKFLPLDLVIEGAGKVTIDINQLEHSASVYSKFFFDSGFGPETEIEGVCVRTVAKRATMWLPVHSKQNRLTLSFFVDNENVSIKGFISDESICFDAQVNTWTNHSLKIPSDDSRCRWLLNNAGTSVSSAGEVQDIGFGMPDDPSFDEPVTVDALCGGAMLIRPKALNGKPLFAGEFFAYFEDTDLSLRIRNSGYQLLYCPTSIVYHKHASTSRENSPFFRYYVNRNRILFYALHFPETFWRSHFNELRLSLNHLKKYCEKNPCSVDEKEFCRQTDKLLGDLDRLLPKVSLGTFYERKRVYPKIGVYNKYWNCLGGGEHHALVIATELQRFGQVDLLSESDFDIRALELQFHVSLKYCRKVIVLPEALHHDESVTGSYHLFVNSTYGSDLTSYAHKSFYIVSFPYPMSKMKKNNRNFLESYDVFLPNSKYTASWVNDWWGVRGEVLYPSIQIPENSLWENHSKEKIILNVGRFFWEGHNKKQLEMVSIFMELVDKGLAIGWRLVLAGQVQEGDEDYVKKIRSIAEGYSIEILENVPRNKLEKLYLQTAIYWHATGLNEDLQRFPDRAEHFGISTLEAMSWGAIPIGIKAGGQVELIQHGKNGFLFSNAAELFQYTLDVIFLFQDDRANYDCLSESARQLALQFSRDKTQEHFRAIIEKHGFVVSLKEYLY